GLRLEVAAVRDLQAVIEQAPPPEGADVVLQFVARMIDRDGNTHSVNFSEPVHLDFIVPAEQIPDNADLDDLVLVYWDGSRWVEVVATGSMNTDGSVTLTATVQHFTLFSVIWAPPGWGAFDPAPHVSGATLSRWLGGGYARLDRALGEGGSVWLPLHGGWLGYTVGVPDWVNQRFREAYAGGLPTLIAGVVMQPTSED